jgi:AraC-like DNA-binding protein
MPIRIHSAALFRCAIDWSWDTGKTPFYDHDFWYVAAGGGSLLTPVGMFDIAAGSCFILRGGQRYIAAHDAADPLTVYAVHFSGSAADLGLHRVVGEPELMRQLLARVVARWNDRDVDGATLWFGACLDELRAAAGASRRGTTGIARRGSTTRGTGERGADTESISRIKTLISAILDDPASAPRIAEFAERTGVSRQHFTRLFKTIAGTGPKEFIVDARIGAAKILLKNSDHPIKRVAALCGYPDEFLFSRVFKRISGKTPGAFRRSDIADRGPNR